MFLELRDYFSSNAAIISREGLTSQDLQQVAKDHLKSQSSQLRSPIQFILPAVGAISTTYFGGSSDAIVLCVICTCSALTASRIFNNAEYKKLEASMESNDLSNMSDIVHKAAKLRRKNSAKAALG